MNVEQTNGLDRLIADGREELRGLVKAKEMRRPERRQEVQELLNGLPPQAVPHPSLRVLERHRLSVDYGISFHAIMIQRSEARKRLKIVDRGWLLDRKDAGYRFADNLGFRRPWTSQKAVAFSELKGSPGTVVKPANSTGARGVYAIIKKNSVVDVRRGETITWNRATRRAQKLLEREVRPLADRWMVEELILDEHGNLARDYKFYTFYGKVLFVQEIERFPTFRATFWDRDGRPLATGKPAQLEDVYGVSERHIHDIERLSLSIPAPFMRIDTLRADPATIVLGEFTPRPGQFEQFDRKTDRILGEEWMSAERRLLDDALSGKKFKAFIKATESMKDTTSIKGLLRKFGRQKGN